MDRAHPGRRSAVAAAACFAGVAAVAVAWFVLPSDETRIRRAIPGAAAMPRAAWREVLAATEAIEWHLPGFDGQQDQTLTTLFVLGPLPWRGLADGPADVGLLGDPCPADLIDALDARSPVTVIAGGDIVRFTCQVEGGLARGPVEFEAKGLWRGQVEYRAERRTLVWTITEFRLPASRMGVRLGAGGRWRFFREPGQ